MHSNVKGDALKLEAVQRNKIDMKFEELRAKGEGALIGYLTLGDPNIEDSKKIVKALAKHVDILELGIPFSDPIADGPTIQGAIDRALKAGMNTDIAFEIVKELNLDIPLIFMTYYNIVLQYGEERFIKRCRDVGVDGVIIVDLPIEEAQNLLDICEKYNVHFIFLIAPTTREDRLFKILSRARGFIYLISLLGVTGAREKLQEETIEKTKWALNYVKIPLAVGFGISKKEHVRAVIKAGASGVVVGSAFVKIIEKNLGNIEKAIDEIEKLAKELKEGTKVK